MVLQGRWTCPCPQTGGRGTWNQGNDDKSLFSQDFLQLLVLYLVGDDVTPVSKVESILEEEGEFSPPVPPPDPPPDPPRAMDGGDIIGPELKECGGGMKPVGKAAELDGGNPRGIPGLGDTLGEAENRNLSVPSVPREPCPVFSYLATLRTGLTRLGETPLVLKC